MNTYDSKPAAEYTLTPEELEKYYNVKAEMNQVYDFSATPVTENWWDCTAKTRDGKSFITVSGPTKGDAFRKVLHNILPTL